MQQKRLKQLQEETEIEYSPVSFNRPLLWMHNVEQSKTSNNIWTSFAIGLLCMVAFGVALWSTIW